MGIPASMSGEQVARAFFGMRVSKAARRSLEYRSLRVARLLLKEAAVCAFAAVFLTQWLPAQQPDDIWLGPEPAPRRPIFIPQAGSGHGHAGPAASPGLQPPNTARIDDPCSLWTVVGVQGATVSTVTLQVPENARGEYRKGCSDLKGKKLANAEQHLRKAVQEYPQYAAAWVLLGQVLEAGNRMEDARSACSQASSADSRYAPAYLCLADVAARQKEWNQTLDLADRALALDPLQDVYGHFYSTIAEFRLGHLPAAERNALKTIDADHLHRVPQTHLLLAQIYLMNHDPYGATAQLQAYLKVAPNSLDSAGVRKTLADLEHQTQK